MEPEEGLNGPPTRGPPSLPIIGAEDEDFENDIDPTPEEKSPEFQSLELLRTRPLPLVAFLQHVVLQFDSCPLLCYLHVEMLRRTNPKESRKQFLEFCHLFLDKAGLLRVPLPPHLQLELERWRAEPLPEDSQRKFLREIQAWQEPEIHRQLQDFRSKRLMGMTPGEPELAELEQLRAGDPSGWEAKEKVLAEQLLGRLEDMHPTISSDEEKSSAIFGAVSSYLKSLGVKTKGGDAKKPKSHFFRKKISGNKKEELQGKARRGFLWGRDPHGAEWRQSKGNPPEGGEGEKPPPGGGSQRPEGGGGGSQRPPRPPQDPPPSPLPTESSEAEPGVDPPGVSEGGDPSPQETLPTEGEEGGDGESLEPGGPGGGFGDPQNPEEPRPEPELEQDPPPWRDLADPQILPGLSPREIRRQEVINELFLTEHAHVRMLRVLLEVFFQPMLREGFFDEHELSNIFPSLEDLVEVHTLFLDGLKRLREESGFVIGHIGDVLLARFEGTEGSWFQKISARFCSRQSFALEQLKAKQRKDARFNQFIQEAESRPRCRRLQLKDIIPTEMQRLTKYPLLLHSITKCSEPSADRAKVEQAAECCRQILNHVNQEVRDMENFMKLKDYQRRLDLSNLKQITDPLLSEFKNTDITKRSLVHEGPLTWRVTRDKAVEVQVLLLDDLLVLLQRQEERLVLRWHSRALAPAPDGKQTLSPVIRLRSAMTREVATDPKAFYVIISWESGAQIYELVAQSVSERKHWCSIISDTAGSLKVPGAQRAKTPRVGGHGAPSPLDSDNGGALKEPLPLDERERVEGTDFEDPPPKKLEGLLRPPPGTPEVGEGLAEAALHRVSVLRQLLPPGGGEFGDPPQDPPQDPRAGGGERRHRGDGAESGEGAAGVSPAGPWREGGGPHLGGGPGRAPPGLPPALQAWLGEQLRGLEETLLGLKEMEARYRQLVAKPRPLP